MISSDWWQLHECENALSDYWDSCDIATRDEIWTSLQMLREQGNLCSSNVSEALGHGYGLFALKAKSTSKKVRIRMLFFFFSKERRRVIFVDVLEKKKRALEPLDLKRALRRKAEIEASERNAEPFRRKPDINGALKDKDGEGSTSTIRKIDPERDRGSN